MLLAFKHFNYVNTARKTSITKLIELFHSSFNDWFMFIKRFLIVNRFSVFGQYLGVCVIIA